MSFRQNRGNTGYNPLAASEAAGADQNISGAGSISGSELFGTLALALTLVASGISSGEALGSPSLSMNVQASGIISAQAAGTPGLSLNLLPTGIATAEAEGQPTLAAVLAPGGIGTAEAFRVICITRTAPSPSSEGWVM